MLEIHTVDTRVGPFVVTSNIFLPVSVYRLFQQSRAFDVLVVKSKKENCSIFVFHFIFYFISLLIKITFSYC